MSTGVRSAISFRSLNRHVSPRWYTVVPPMLITRPLAKVTVPSGVVELWSACTSFTQPQSKVTVPPRFGSETFSTPFEPSQPAVSTSATV